MSIQVNTRKFSIHLFVESVCVCDDHTR